MFVKYDKHSENYAALGDNNAHVYVLLLIIMNDDTFYRNKIYYQISNFSKRQTNLNMVLRSKLTDNVLVCTDNCTDVFAVNLSMNGCFTLCYI